MAGKTQHGGYGTSIESLASPNLGIDDNAKDVDQAKGLLTMQCTGDCAKENGPKGYGMTHTLEAISQISPVNFIGQSHEGYCYEKEQSCRQKLLG